MIGLGHSFAQVFFILNTLLKQKADFDHWHKVCLLQFDFPSHYFPRYLFPPFAVPWLTIDLAL